MRHGVSLKAATQLELGQLYCDRGEFDSAQTHLLGAAEEFLKSKDYSNYLHCSNLLLRIHAERDEHQQINEIKEKLQDLVLKEGFELNSKTYYTLAICASYKEQNQTALEYLQKALSIALALDSKEDICKAILGIAKVYTHPSLGRMADALKEIYNLEVFFQVYNFPEIKISARILNSQILLMTNKPEEALEVAWKAYDELRFTKNTLTWAYMLSLIGEIYLTMGEKDLAYTYINLSIKSLIPECQVRLYRYNKKLLEKVGLNTQQSYDLMFDNENHVVVEKKLGRIDFKNQFILLDLLKLFLQNPGVVFSKEYLVENVWKQPYDPAVHDNKIYVTIKRLRKLIEPDYEKPKYVFRAKNGYYMNKNARVYVETAGHS